MQFNLVIWCYWFLMIKSCQNQFTYDGCYTSTGWDPFIETLTVDQCNSVLASGDSVMSGGGYNGILSNTMTIQKCFMACIAGNFVFAGLALKPGNG